MRSSAENVEGTVAALAVGGEGAVAALMVGGEGGAGHVELYPTDLREYYRDPKGKPKRGNLS